jgi:ribonuclease E
MTTTKRSGLTPPDRITTVAISTAVTVLVAAAGFALAGGGASVPESSDIPVIETVVDPDAPAVAGSETATTPVPGSTDDDAYDDDVYDDDGDADDDDRETVTPNVRVEEPDDDDDADDDDDSDDDDDLDDDLDDAGDDD